MRLARAVIGVLAEDHDADLLGRRQVERPEPFDALGEDALAGRLLRDQEALQLGHVRLVELGAEPRAPALVQLDLLGFAIASRAILPPLLAMRHHKWNRSFPPTGWPIISATLSSTIVDSSWHMPASGRSGRDEYLAAHIPGARFLDIDEVSDRANPAPHMLPSAQRIRGSDGKLGIGRTIASSSMIIRRCAARRAAGSCSAISARIKSRSSTAACTNGLPKDARPKAASRQPRDARFEAESARRDRYQAQILAGGSAPLLDARGKGRFEGERGRSAPGSRGGPHSGRAQPSFAGSTMVMARSSRPDEINRLFAEAGVDPRSPSSPLAVLESPPTA